MPIGIYKPSSGSGGDYDDTDVAAYLLAQGFTASKYDYVQQAKPGSPSVGDRWLELDASGNIVNSWFVENTGTYWLSDNIITVPAMASGAVALLLTATTTLTMSPPFHKTFTNIWVDSTFCKVINPGTALDGTNFWTFAMGVCTTVAATLDAINTFTFNSQAGNTVTSQENVVNAAYNAVSFGVTATKTGTVNVRIGAGINCRRLKTVA